MTEQEKRVRRLVLNATQEAARAEGNVNDALYWAKGAIEDIERHVTENSGAHRPVGGDLDRAVEILKVRRDALRTALRYAYEEGVDVSEEIGWANLAYVPEVKDA